jgi:hypothetical protein
VNGFSAAISGVGSAVGRYFSIVSFIPSLLLTGFTFALIECGAWSGNGGLDWVRAGSALTRIGNVAVLILISIALGIVVHPMQFAMVQFFEGYWGTRRWAQRARVVRILHHRDRFRSYFFGPGLDARMALKKVDDAATLAVASTEQPAHLEPEVRVTYRSIADESRRLAGGYPRPNIVGKHEEYDNIMPTRLGNALKKYERQAGSQYGLDAVSVIQHLSFVAPPERLGYISDQRQLLDLSVRMSATSIVATLIAIAALWRHGPWLLLALAPYGVAYLSYRGAVVVAHEYGAAVAAMIDLDRFALYDSLRLPRPHDTAAERRMNAKLMKLLTQDPNIVLRYEYPETAGSTGGQSTAP